MARPPDGPAPSNILKGNERSMREIMQDAPLAEQPVQLSCEPDQRSPELSVIVPTFNEAPNVELVVGALVVALRGIDWEVIFVDDDSSAGTTNAVRLIARGDGRVRCIRRLGRLGLSGEIGMGSGREGVWKDV